MKPDTYSVTIVWSDEYQAFVTEVSELPGCMAHGESSEQYRSGELTPTEED
jgi:predicted RNase H-like HicB family nuclease